MKRASLSLSPTTPPPPTADLTDRLLNPQTPKPKSKKTKSKTPSPSIAPVVAVLSVSSIDQALSQSRAAVEALHVAAQAAPARHSVAIKYRLDALAHHVAQVAEFMEHLKAA